MWFFVLSAAFADAPIDPAALPEAVRGTMEREWPGTPILGADVGPQGIGVFIEDEGVRREVIFTVSSTWSRVQREIGLAEVPAAVLKAAKPLGKATAALEVRGPAGTVSYELTLVKGKGTVHARYDALGAKLE